MSLPVFFAKEITPDVKEYRLDEAASRHCIQVLRMSAEEPLQLTDGRGHCFHAVIKVADRRQTLVRILSCDHIPPRNPSLAIGIAFTKNNSRMEWFLEKATEIGVHRIIPLLCRRSEKEKFRHDRFENILIAAMIQSQQYHLPVLEMPAALESVLNVKDYTQRLIAHCGKDPKPFISQVLKPGETSLVLIGPEGDFTPEEIQEALSQGFTAISLGDTRLRTETAGVVACACMNAVQHS